MPSSPVEANDDSVQIPTPTSLPSPHQLCPPEEDRDYQAPREERLEIIGQSPPNANATPTSLPTPGPDNDVEQSTVEDPVIMEDVTKHVECLDNTLTREPPKYPVPFPFPAEDVRDSDAHLAQSMSAAALSSELAQNLEHNPSHRHRVSSNSTSSFLRPGSKFQGTQQSDRQVYNVQVEIKHVDMDESFLCGYLRIQGLTDDHPTLTTYFEGEIIGNKHVFETAHPEWGSSRKVDMQHWARFPAYRPLHKQAASSDFSYVNFAQREHLFMRWKEYFLVPDHKVKTITGASFEGFYYICFNQCLGTVSGIYFHAKSEKFQQLMLEHVDDRGCMGAMEFR